MSSDPQFNDALCQFATDLYDQIIKSQTQLANVFWSPMSVHCSIAMLMAGTSGVTNREIIKTLHLHETLSESQAHELLGSTIVNVSQSSRDVDVSVANRLFLLKPVTILSEFFQTLSKHYGAELESLTGLSGLEERRIRMNDWVANETKGKVTDLIPSGALSGNTALALLSAIYFKGLWKHPFPKNRTENATFYLPDSKTLEVPMMHIKTTLSHYWLADVDANAIRLPFLGAEWEMLVVVTRERGKLPNLLSHLREPGKLSELLKVEYDVIEMDLFLPKFKLAKSKALDLKELLQKCGMTTVFDETHADLSRMCSTDHLFVSEILHKAVLEVDEEGATAAAATAVTMNLRCAFRTPTFRVDHPFFIALVYKSAVPAFMGHIVTPEVF